MIVFQNTGYHVVYKCNICMAWRSLESGVRQHKLYRLAKLKRQSQKWVYLKRSIIVIATFQKVASQIHITISRFCACRSNTFQFRICGVNCDFTQYNHSFVFPEVMCREGAIVPLGPLLNLPVGSAVLQQLYGCLCRLLTMAVINFNWKFLNLQLLS